MEIYANIDLKNAGRVNSMLNGSNSADGATVGQITNVVPTSRGQLIGHNGTAPTALAAPNSSNQVLKGNPGSGVGWSWGFPNFATSNTVRSSNFTVAANEAFSFLVVSGTITITIPNNSHQNGSIILVFNVGSGTITIAPAANVAVVGQNTINTTNQCLKLCLGLRTASSPPQDTWYAFI